jgi:hypothetical protein
MRGLQFTRTPAGNRRPVKNQTNNKGIYYTDVKVRVKPDYSRNTMSVNNLPVNPDNANKNIGKQLLDPIADIENKDKLTNQEPLHSDLEALITLKPINHLLVLDVDVSLCPKPESTNNDAINNVSASYVSAYDPTVVLFGLDTSVSISKINNIVTNLVESDYVAPIASNVSIVVSSNKKTFDAFLNNLSYDTSASSAKSAEELVTMHIDASNKVFGTIITNLDNHYVQDAEKDVLTIHIDTSKKSFGTILTNLDNPYVLDSEKDVLTIHMSTFKKTLEGFVSAANGVYGEFAEREWPTLTINNDIKIDFTPFIADDVDYANIYNSNEASLPTTNGTINHSNIGSLFDNVTTTLESELTTAIKPGFLEMHINTENMNFMNSLLSNAKNEPIISNNSFVNSATELMDLHINLDNANIVKGMSTLLVSSEKPDKSLDNDAKTKSPDFVEMPIYADTKNTMTQMLNNVEHFTDTSSMAKPTELMDLHIEMNSEPVNLGMKDVLTHVSDNNEDSIDNENGENNGNNENNERKADIAKMKLEIALTTNNLINVYQLQYTNKLASGLGDFIRGSYFLMQFCRDNLLQCFIDMSNHPLSVFMEKYRGKHTSPFLKHAFSTVESFDTTNHNPHLGQDNVLTSLPNFDFDDKVFEYLVKQPRFGNNLFVYTIAYPNYEVPDIDKALMRDILYPTLEIQIATNNILTKLQLEKHKYEVIHVRYGDAFLFQDETDEVPAVALNKLTIMMKELNQLDYTRNKYLLVADNNFIKGVVKRYFPAIRFVSHDIAHTGERNDIDYDKLKNTMVDFCLISYATNVKAYSSYMHGTGFSKWCAETYDIPYECKYLGSC